MKDFVVGAVFVMFLDVLLNFFNKPDIPQMTFVNRMLVDWVFIRHV